MRVGVLSAVAGREGTDTGVISLLLSSVLAVGQLGVGVDGSCTDGAVSLRLLRFILLMNFWILLALSTSEWEPAIVCRCVDGRLCRSLKYLILVHQFRSMGSHGWICNSTSPFRRLISSCNHPAKVVIVKETLLNV